MDFFMNFSVKLITEDNRAVRVQDKEQLNDIIQQFYNWGPHTCKQSAA